MGDNYKEGTMHSVHIWVLLSTSLVVTLASSIVLAFVLANKAARKDFFLLSICVFSLVYGVGFSVEAILFKEGGSERQINLASIIGNFGMNYSHWLFQILLLRSALMIPVIFETAKVQVDDMSTFQKHQARKVRRINWIVVLLVVTCTTVTAIPFFFNAIYANFYVWMQFIQAFTEIAIVLFLRF